VHEALVLLRLVHFAAAMTGFGGAAFRLYAIDGGAAGEPAAALALFDRWLARLLRTSALVMLVSALAIVPCVAALMAGEASAALDPATVVEVLSATAFGRVWCWHLLFAALLLISAGVAGQRHTLTLTWTTLALASLGWVGHAAGGGGWIGVGHEVNQSAHLLAAALWLGGLLPLGWLLGRARWAQDDGFAALARQALPPFSQMGYAAVAAIAVTGAINTVLLVGGLDALFGTAYGRLLSLKILLYLAMVAIALRNRFRLMPRLAARQTGKSSALYRSIVIEQALGFAILAAVSLLGTWPPPGPGHHH
jgi:putative copper resistance protein D